MRKPRVGLSREPGATNVFHPATLAIMTDGAPVCLSPSPALLAKLGSIIVHAQEGASEDGHSFDWHALDVLMRDSDVVAWLKGMQALSLIPLKRK